MQLSQRLQAVADMVTPGYRVADVGCDHAYISIYLAEHRIASHIIAMDVNQGPINRARENIMKYGYDNFIETRKSDGLKKLEIGETDSVIIAGMGGELTVQILTQSAKIMQSVKELILQPQSELHKVRRLLTDRNFLILNENMLKEDGKFYFMFRAVPVDITEAKEKFRLVKTEDFYYGRLLLEQENPILKEYLLWDLSLCEGILDTLGAGHSEQVLQRKREIMERVELIRKGLSYYH